MTSPAFFVIGLRNASGDVMALDTVRLEAVRLEASAGSARRLLGRIGSGKTTAVSILATALRPDQGHVKECGFGVRTHGADVCRASPAPVSSLPWMRSHICVVSGALAGAPRLNAPGASMSVSAFTNATGWNPRFEPAALACTPATLTRLEAQR